jgi:hypothetical protein
MTTTISRIGHSGPGDIISHSDRVGAGSEQPPQTPANLVTETIPGPSGFVGVQDQAVFKMAADTVDELEALRMAAVSRLGQLTRTGPDEDGIIRGLGMPLDDPAVIRLAWMIEQIRILENKAVGDLEKQMRTHPMGSWVKKQCGLGGKQMARLLAAIGDPYVMPAMKDADGVREPARVRTLAELRGYCGLGVVDVEGVGFAPRKRKGHRVHWDPAARMRLRLVTESCMKQLRKPCLKVTELGYALHDVNCHCSPYRVVYDDARAKYADAVHLAPCSQCVPKRSGLVAPAGSPLKDGHKHARALRMVGREVLKNLWAEARRLHTETGDIG